ncbi:cytosine-specific methyltransferase, putative [Medicago truncatula]|uniref:Cytosine-specific methyltransferase, putative n=1 Tax=Medicago truncatula TaxID=3880 RepID=G7K5R6_MEDTR|nr:cytosine-specific methyltransferase, putative [Medicago truncatula]
MVVDVPVSCPGEKGGESYICKIIEMFESVDGELFFRAYICKIIEMFKSVDGELFFRAQWQYRAKDTIKNKDILSEISSTVSSHPKVNGKSFMNTNMVNTKKPELKLLDLYSGCGGMSTDLCQGGLLSSSKMRWAVNMNEHECIIH